MTYTHHNLKNRKYASAPSRIKSKEETIKIFILQPLFEAYQIVRSEDVISNTTHEDTITRRIIDHIKRDSSISIYTDKTIDISFTPGESSENGGLTRPDIKFFISDIIKIFIEAKRIYKGSTPGTYCGKEGLGRFLSGYYSSQEGHAGMIAYIQEGRLSDIQKEIIKKVNGCNCTELKEDLGIDNSFLSLHKRNSNSNIKIYHLLFDFVQH
ncbi:MAG: hypothetical protein BWK75_04100 [Candidatus Altiarchaeales archaeon A3]|nr:MAG: hypothetical protein BWK75_04100 [Candidatus Altiarchaeales archaeon A3]